MKLNITSVNREHIKRARTEKKKNLKDNNKKTNRNIKKYKDTYEI